MRRAVKLSNNRAFFKSCRIRTESHCVTHISLASNNIFLLFHSCDYWISTILLELCGISIFKTKHVTSILNNHRLQAKAKTKRWQTMLASVTERANLTFNATNAETAWNNHAVHLVKSCSSTFLSFALISSNPSHVYLSPVCKTASLNGLRNGKIRIW